MFNYINGLVSELAPDMTVLDCGGVGFEIQISACTAGRLKLGEKAKLLIYSNIREDCFDLFGFYDKSERRLFELLISVSGVGPKAAMSILSSSTPEQLAMAVISGDDRALMAAPGIGKKIAQRIILELKDKLAKQTGELSFRDTVPITPAVGAQTAVHDAAAALAVLGYGSAEINSAIKQIDASGMSVEDIVKACLRLLVK